MPSMNLLQGDKGGGGLPGANKWVILGDTKFKKHAFPKTKDEHGNRTVAKGQTPTEFYEKSCMFSMPFEIEEPDDDLERNQEQWYPVGNLPNTPGSLTGPGGYLPSVDNETGAEEGPFVISEGVNNFGGPITGIWELKEYMQLMDEFNNVAAASDGKSLKDHQEVIAAKGMAALKGTRVHLVAKVWKVSDKKTAKGEKGRVGLVPDQIDYWGWDKKAVGKAAGKPAAAAGGPRAAVAAFARSSEGNGADDNAGDVSPFVLDILSRPPLDKIKVDPALVDQRSVEVVKAALEKAGGSISYDGVNPSQFAQKHGLMALTLKDGAARGPIMAVASKEEFWAEKNGVEWILDDASKTIVAV